VIVESPERLAQVIEFVRRGGLAIVGADFDGVSTLHAQPAQGTNVSTSSARSRQRARCSSILAPAQVATLVAERDAHVSKRVRAVRSCGQPTGEAL
jgi:hypothetical protein